MICPFYPRALLLAAVVLLGCAFAPTREHAQSAAKNGNNPQDRAGTSVTLRWVEQADVTRYRLQLAADAAFTDIIFDRVVCGHEYTVSDLAPGKYFWHVAPLTTALGDFTPTTVIEVAPEASATRDALPAAATSSADSTNTVKAGRSWFAATGNVAKPILARLRAQNRFELIATTDDGRVVAIDVLNDLVLWTVRPQALRAGTSTGIPPAIVLAITARNGLDNLLLLSNTATLLEGRTGRTLWQTNLPSLVSSAAVSGDKILVIDSSLQKMLVMSAIDGRILSDVRLPRRAVGSPISVLWDGTRTLIVALDDGRLQMFDESGKLIAEGVQAAGGLCALTGTKAAQPINFSSACMARASRP